VAKGLKLKVHDGIAFVLFPSRSRKGLAIPLRILLMISGLEQKLFELRDWAKSTRGEAYSVGDSSVVFAMNDLLELLKEMGVDED
jgi:hypothetical protein